MKYNLAKYTQTISNTAEGSIHIPTDDIIQIISTTAANVYLPTGSGTISGTLVLDCDLGVRVHVDEVQYHFDSAAPESTVTSGIKFFYKNEDFEVYVSLNTYFNGSYYYTLVSGTEAPRYIRVVHTVISGAEGNLNGFQVLNDDTYVDFGEDGTDTDHNVMLSLENAIIEINTMFVHNSGPIKANAKLLLEPQNTVADDILSIAASPDGPWYGIYQDEDMVTGPSLWATGSMADLKEAGNILKLEDTKTVGTYTTRVVELDENQRLTFNVMSYNYPIKFPEVAFFDDFSAAGVNWYRVSSYRYQYNFAEGYMDIWNPTGDDGSMYLQTIRTDYDYGDDWEFTCKHIYQLSSGGGAYLYFLWPLSDFYFIYSSPIQVFLYLNGTGYDLVPLKDWAAGDGLWHNIKVRRSFTALRFKIWLSTDDEPVDWMWTGTIQPEALDLPFTGGIRVLHQKIISPVGDHVYYDNFKVVNNASATGSTTSFIATEATDSIENIEVRSSNSQPLDRLTYIELTGNYGASTKYTQHRWVVDGTVAETSVDWAWWGRSGNFFEVWYDSKREDEYIVDKPWYSGTYGDTIIYFRIRRKDGSLLSSTISNGDYDYDCYYNTYKITPDSQGGFWIYFYLSRSGSSGGNYYLRYYNSSLSIVYNRQATAAQGTFLYDFDVVYESTGDLWYTDRDLSTVFKMNREGIIITSYLATSSIRGIFALDDGGCWFIQEGALIRLDSAGVFVESIELPTTIASYVYSDLDGGFWLQDGYTIRHLRPDGTEYFNVEIPNLYFFTVADSGVITKQGDGASGSTPKASYVSKGHKGIVRTWDYPRSEGQYKGTFDYNRLGVRSHTYDDLVSDHASHFPIAIDDQWNTFSDWVPVSLRDGNFSGDQYHQMRFTLRADNSANSPEVYGLWTQRAVEVPDIYPGNAGKYYLKSDISYLGSQDTGNYTSKVRAYWYLNTE